jgi:thioredoxin-like negative regulator of GroEL
MTDFMAFSREAAAKGDAFAAYRLVVAALEAEPENAEAWYELGVRLEGFKKHAAAVGAYRRADALRPGHHETLTNLGLNLGLVGRFAEAREVLERAVMAAPDMAAGYLQLAQVLYAVGQPSLADAKAAVACDPDSPIAHLQLAFSLMTSGKWVEGFREYEWRFRYKLQEFLSYPYPLWRGERVGTLVLSSEQGLGDSIMMMRYVQAAVTRAEQVIWLCHKEVYGLAKQLATRLTADLGVLWVTPIPSALPPGDAFCPMMSLPVALGEGPMWDGPYVTAAQRWSSPADTAFRVGVVWAGSPVHENAQHRDMPLTALLPLAEIPGVEVVSLQVGAGLSQMDAEGAHALVRDMSGKIADLADTAQLIAGLDLVISVDTAVAHLAGAMGRPMWMVVNQRARDWRWGRWTTETPWYPTMRIFARMLDEHNWDAVVSRVGEALRDRMADKEPF